MLWKTIFVGEFCTSIILMAFDGFFLLVGCSAIFIQ